MTGPRLVLPAAAMPWGRWLEGEQADAQRALEAAKAEPSGFPAAADLMARQISALDSLSEIKQVNVPNFSGYITAAPSDPRAVIIASPEYVIQAPLLRSVSARVIVNFTMTSNPASIVSNYYPVLKLNGQPVRANQAYANLNNNASASVSGTVEASAGQNIVISFGAGLGQGLAGTVDISNCSIWVAFYGSIS